MTTLPALLDHLRTNRDFVANVVAWERIPARRRLARAEQELAAAEADALPSSASAAAGKVGGLP